MSTLLTRRFLASRRQIARNLARAFPTATPEDVEDALADAYADLLAASNISDPRAGLIQVAAWRRLRGVFRRHARRFERPCSGSEGLSQAARPGQEVVLSAARWLELFERVVCAHGGPHKDALRRAILDKMETGDTDQQVAARHGIRRERLNRAWRAFLDAMLPG